MPRGASIHKSYGVSTENFYSLIFLPAKSTIAVISSFIHCFYPRLFTAIHQTSTSLTINPKPFFNRTWINHSQGKKPVTGFRSSLFFVLIAASILSCQSQTMVGVKKDFGTGLKTEYRNIEPEEAMLVMNDEVLGHTDIPLGEQFTIINKGVKGLTEKKVKHR